MDLLSCFKTILVIATIVWMTIGVVVLAEMISVRTFPCGSIFRALHTRAMDVVDASRAPVLRRLDALDRRVHMALMRAHGFIERVGRRHRDDIIARSASTTLLDEVIASIHKMDHLRKELVAASVRIESESESKKLIDTFAKSLTASIKSAAFVEKDIQEGRGPKDPKGFLLPSYMVANQGLDLAWVEVAQANMHDRAVTDSSWLFYTITTMTQLIASC